MNPTTTTNDTTPTSSTTTAAPAAEAEESLSLPLDELGADEAALLASWKGAGNKDGDDSAPDAGDGAQSNDDTAAPADGETNDEGGNDEKDGEGDGETEDDADEDKDGDGDEDGDKKDADDARDKTPVQKRIDKLTAQKKELQEQLGTLQSENEALKSGAPKPGQPVALVPLPEDPLSTLTSAQEVEDAMARAEETIAWCKENRSGATVPKTPGGTDMVEMTADQIADIRDRQEELLRKHGPGRLQWLETYQTAHAAAKTAYPDLFAKDSKQQQFVREMFRHIPGLARHPMHEMFIGDMLVGAGVRAGTMKVVRATPPAKTTPAAAATTTAGKPAAPSTARASLSSASAAPPARPRGARADNSALMEKALSGGSGGDDAVEAMLASKFG